MVETECRGSKSRRNKISICNHLPADGKQKNDYCNILNIFSKYASAMQ